jgi:hypothetical protein
LTFDYTTSFFSLSRITVYLAWERSSQYKHKKRCLFSLLIQFSRCSRAM